MLLKFLVVTGITFCCLSNLLADNYYSDDLATTSVHTLAADKHTTIQTQLITVDPINYLNKVYSSLPDTNKAIAREFMSYRRDGSHKYWWPRKGESAYDGSTTDVLINGVLALKGEPKAQTFCCGLTLEVFYKVAPQFNAAGIFNQESLTDFKRLWFCEKLFSPGPTDALLKYNMGQEIKNWKDVRSGDFVQLWRNNKSGHSVIFVNWVFKPDSVEPEGFTYWSTQTSTNGINFNTELYGNYPRHMSRDSTSFVRFKP